MKTGLTVESEREPIEKVAINTIRTLCMDAVQTANSGHPRSPIGMAPTAYVWVGAICRNEWTGAGYENIRRVGAA
jgi:transketolase